MIDNEIKEDDYSIEEEKLKKVNILRQDGELFDDDAHKPHDIISVKRIEYKNGGEDWEILSNKENVLTLKGVRFTKKEKLFFRTVKGIQFIISGYKEGWNSVSEFKKNVKKVA